MNYAPQPAPLNPSQRLHLLSRCQYADKLLGDMEAALAASESSSPFPRFRSDLTSVQSKTVRDYIASLRARMVRALAGMDVAIPAASIGALHSLRVTLTFLASSLEECRPQRMAGYGDLPAAVSTQLSGMVDELQSIVAHAEADLAQDQSADLAQRLDRLAEAGADVQAVRDLAAVIDLHGLVGFRPALAAILARLELPGFEIAVFGRVSCGKSSFLNRIVGSHVLPVGVNPVTAVPTRLAYGPEPRLTVAFAGRPPEPCQLSRIAEFATEERNPSNTRRITALRVELPAAALRQGIVYVDTPGLGSLATSGAAETRAYLPRCDLGVVLIDAASTLTPDDLATLQALVGAGIPASVLLSKADLLSPEDCERACQYAARQVQNHLGMELSVDPVSVRPAHVRLLDVWIERQIAPLRGRHAELARQALARQIERLRRAVEAALAAPPAGDLAALHAAAGRIAEAREQAIALCDSLHHCTGEIVAAAAAAMIADPSSPLSSHLAQAVARKTEPLAALMLATAARADLPDVVRNMPRFECGDLPRDLAAGIHARFVPRWAARRLAHRIDARAGRQIEEALAAYRRALESWVRATSAELSQRLLTAP